MTKIFPFVALLEIFGGTFSSNCIGSVLDFFTGNITRASGGLGGFLGVESKIGGEKGPLEFGDSTPLLGVAPFPIGSGI